MKFFIFIYVLSIVFIIGNCLNISIEKPKKSGNFFQVDLKEFVKNGLEEMSAIYNSTRISKKAVMVLGLSGTGKTTLVNYLNDIPLISTKKGSKWILDLKYPNVTLPFGFKIGHTDKSETQYPAVYTPNDKDFTYIDNPSFKGYDDVGFGISNGFFLEQITKQIDHLKFVLLITYQDLNLRGEQFKDTIRAFSNFLGIFEDKDTKDLAKSILILVTRVEEDETDEEMILYFKKRLEEILIEGKTSGFFKNVNEESVFREIVTNNQIGIFSNPRKNITLDNKQSLNIHSQIDKLQYIKTKDVKIRVVIQESFKPKLLSYTQDLYNLFLTDYQVKLKMYLEIFYENLIKNANNVQVMTQIVVKLNQIPLVGSGLTDIEPFPNKLIKQNFLTTKTQVCQLIEQQKWVDFLLQLMPDQNRKSFELNKNWINGDLTEQLKKTC